MCRMWFVGEEKVSALRVTRSEQEKDCETDVRPDEEGCDVAEM
jgi:hypothetical protein